MFFRACPEFEEHRNPQIPFVVVSQLLKRHKAHRMPRKGDEVAISLDGCDEARSTTIVGDREAVLRESGR